MEEKEEAQASLGRMSTEWDLVFQAHRGPPEPMAEAQAMLIRRYAGAVHRYLLGAVRDPDVAAELSQEFALRFLRGDFHRADPARGRFRDFVKQALRNLMTDYRRRQWARPRPLGVDVPEPAHPSPGLEDFDRQFLIHWRQELMARAWDALARLQERTGQPYHTVLRLRVDHPELRSPQMAERLSALLGRQVGAGGVRQTLHRARDRFVEFLLAEVVASLKDPTSEQVQEELIELGLWDYCRPAISIR